jgi:hypothetical protein
MTGEATLLAESAAVVGLRGHAGEQHLSQLKAQRARAEAALSAWRDWNAALLAVRAAVGRANVATNVSDLLARRESVLRELELVQKLVIPTAHCIKLEDLTSYKPLSEGTYEQNVDVDLMTPALRASAAETVEQLRMQLFRLGNDIADANGQRLSIELPTSVAQQLGLA